ncbi:MAG: ATP-dependent Clp protease proteolytic subunit [Candidatus Dojkabacteria bacterium]|nr:ATP-dependent Clp protease proteolytic subunit [Candidatus Dojkabacteria bacterium]
MAYLIPTVIEKKARGEVAYDIFSRLLEDRIIFIGERINTDVANLVIAQLLFLEKQSNSEDVHIYINCYGGEIAAGLSIIDTMNHIKPDVSTTAVGIAASMGAMLLACGQKGKRFALPNAEVMLHQPRGGVEGQAKEIVIEAEHIVKIRDVLYGLIAKQTGKPKTQIERDSDRNKWMSAKEAVEYGIIDKIIK